MVKKKTFNAQNPAEAFISSASPATAPETAAQPAKETKNRRVNLLLQPSVADGMKALAASKGLSLNELANQTFKDLLAGK